MSEGNAGKIGRYQVLGELGRGGFGCVYRAYDALVGRKVAIKVLTGGGPDVLRRFRNEAQVAGSLRHQNIVTVYEYGEHEGQPFLAMEYLEGEDVQQILAAHKPLTLLEKCNVMSQVAEGLDFAHRNAVVHRDVKPANIMVLPDGRVKIMDFGIARVTEDRGSTRLTQDGWMVGTPLYMAPEQFAGGEVDALCDIFAYGTVFYELLTGRHPFQAPDPRALMYKISVEDPPPVRDFVPECPEALDRVILRILHKDRELRYQSLKDVQFDTQVVRMELQRLRAEELLHQAEKLVAEDHLDKAQALALEALSLDPANPVARSLRENLQKRSQQRALQPRIEGLIAVAEDQLAQRHFSDAVQRFEAALRLDSENPAIRARLEYARTLLEHNKAALTLMADARKELDQRNLTLAFRKVSEALRHDRDNPNATELLDRIQKEMELHQREQRIDETIHRVEGLILLRSYDEAIAALSGLGEEAQSTKVERMLDWLQKEKAEEERKSKLQAEMAAVTDLLRARSFATAVERLEALRTEFPDEQESAHLLDYARKELAAEARVRIIKETTAKANALIEAKDFQPALALLEEHLRQYPREASLIRLLAAAMAAKADWERQQAIARTIKECRQLREQQRFAEAIEMVEATLRDYSGDPELSALLEELEQEWTRKRRAAACRKAAEQASQMLDREQFAEAQQYLRQLVFQYPEEAGLAGLLQRADEALRAIEKARAIEAIAKDASEHAAREDFGRALAALDAGLEVWEGEANLLELRKKIADSESQWARRKEIADCSERASKLAQKHTFAEALALVEEKLRKYPAERDLVELQSRITQEWEQHKRREAIRTIASEARVLLSRGMLNEAADNLKDGLARYSGENELASLAEQAGEAIRVRERARAVENLIRESQAFSTNRRYADARGVLERGLAAFAGDATLMREMASVKAAEEVWTREQAVAKAIADAHKLAADEKFDEALQLLTRSGGNASDAVAARRQIEQARTEHLRRRAITKGAADVQALLDNDRPSDALKLLDRLSAQHTGEPQWAPLRARAVEALAAAKAAEERRRTVEKAVRECGLLARQNQFDDALARVEVALSKYPDEESLAELRGRLRESKEAHKRAEAIAQAADAAQTLIKAGRLEDAVASLQDSVGKYPGEATLRSLLARTEQELAAKQERRKAVQEGTQLLDGGRDEEALRRAESALARFPGDAELTVLAAKATEAGESRRREEAIAALVENAIAAAKARDFDRAFTLLERGLANWPGQQTLLDVERTLRSEQAVWTKEQARRQMVQEIHQLVRKERFGEARRKAEEALQKFAGDPELLRLRKDCRLREILAEANAGAGQGRPKDALQMIEQCASDYESAPEWKALKKRLQEEVVAFERKAAIRQRADEARALAKNADFKAALALLDRSVREWPGEPALEEARKSVIALKEEHERQAAIENAVSVCSRLAEEGRLSDAITEATRHLREFPGEPRLLELMKRFEQLRKEEERQQQRRADLAALQALETKLTQTAQPGPLADLRKAMQQIQDRHGGDQEIASAAAALGRHFSDIDAARAAVSNGNFDAAIDLSARYLGRYPGHASFQAIRSDAERGRRAADLEGIRRKAAAEADLAKRVAILQEALARYPNEPWASGELRITANKLSLAEEIVAQAKAHEAAEEWDQALEEWKKLAAIYDRYPGLPEQLVRAEAAREKTRAEAIARWTSQIERLIQGGELDKARQKLDQALREFPGVEQFLGLGRHLEEMQKKQRRIRELVAGMKGVGERRNCEQLQSRAAEALSLAADYPWLRKSVVTTLIQCARDVLDADWRKAEEWLAMAQSAEPGFAPPEELARSIAKKKRAAGIGAALGQAEKLQSSGRLRDALAHIETALREFSGEARLESARAALAAELDRELARITAEMRAIREHCENAAEPAELDGLSARLAKVAADAARHPELASAAAEVDRAIVVRRRQLARARLWSTLGGEKGLAIALGGVLLAGGAFYAVRLLTPAAPLPVMVTSDPPGAAVSAGGMSCVTSNCTLQLRPGSYTLTAQKEGYKTISQPLTIAATDRDLKVPLTLEAIPWTTARAPKQVAPAPVVEPKQPETPSNKPTAPVQAALEIMGALPQARVSVDGRYVGDTDVRGRFTGEFAPGLHSIEISKEGYQTVRLGARFAAKGAPFRLTAAQLAMAKLPPPPVPAPVTPTAPPPAAPKAAETRPVDQEAQDWARVNNNGRVQDLQDYLRRYPGGAHEREAQAQIAQLQQAEAARADQAAWDSVDKGNKTALQDFIARHGNSPRVPEARALVDGIQRRETAADTAAAESRKKADQDGKKAEQDRKAKSDTTQAVLRTLADYESAFNRLDLTTMERLYNPMPTTLRGSIRGYKSVSFQLKPTDTPVVNGDTATVTCTRTQTVVVRGTGDRFATPTERVRVALSRTNSGWIIRDMTRF